MPGPHSGVIGKAVWAEACALRFHTGRVQPEGFRTKLSILENHLGHFKT